MKFRKVKKEKRTVGYHTNTDNLVLNLSIYSTYKLFIIIMWLDTSSLLDLGLLNSGILMLPLFCNRSKI